MEKIIVPWGKDETLRFDLPAGWRLNSVLEPRDPGRAPELAAELDRALREPIGAPPLFAFAAGKKSAAVVIDDRTRPTPVRAILPRVIAELNAAGIPDGAIAVVIGLGTHREMTPAEVRARVGEELAARVRVMNHGYQRPEELVSLGRTPRFGVPLSLHREVVQADVVVSVGCIEAHEQAGVGGGYKNFMPGVAGPEAVRFTHNPRFQNLPRISSSGMPKSICRFRQAVDECGAMLGPKVFIVNAVIVREKTAAIVAGDPLLAHEAGRAIYEDLAAVRVAQLADVVIADARPLDLDLRVSLKACFNAAAALKPGGVFICLSAAPEGIGDLRLPKSLPRGTAAVVKRAPLGIMERFSGRFNPAPDQAAGTFSLLKMLKRFEAILFLTSLPQGVPVFESLGVKFFCELEALLEAAHKLRPQAEVAVLPHGGASFIAWD